MLQKIHAARAFSMVLNRSRTIGLLPTSRIWRPPGWTSKPAPDDEPITRGLDSLKRPDRSPFVNWPPFRPDHLA